MFKKLYLKIILTSIVVVSVSGNAFSFDIIKSIDGVLFRNFFPNDQRVLLIKEQNEVFIEEGIEEKNQNPDIGDTAIEVINSIKNIFISVNNRPSWLFRNFFPNHPTTLLWQDIDDQDNNRQ